MSGKIVGVIVAPVAAASSGGGIFGLLLTGGALYFGYRLVKAFFIFLFVHPNLSIPLTFLLVGFLTWLVTSASVGADRITGMITLFLLGVVSAIGIYSLADAVFDVWAPVSFVTESCMPYFESAHYWVQSLENIILYWGSTLIYYPVALILGLVLYAVAFLLVSVPLLVCGSFFIFIGEKFEENGLRVIGDITFLGIILFLASSFLGKMEYHLARPMIDSYEFNMIALTAVCLIIAIIGWVKFEK